MANHSYNYTQLQSLSEEVKNIVQKAHVEAKETSAAISERVNTELQDLNTLIKIDPSKMTRAEMEAYTEKSLDNIRNTLKQIEQEIYLWPKIKKWFRDIKYSTYGIGMFSGALATLFSMIWYMINITPNDNPFVILISFVVGVFVIMSLFSGGVHMFCSQELEDRITRFEEDGLVINYDGDKYVIKQYEYGHRDFVYVPFRLIDNNYVSYNKKKQAWDGSSTNIVKNHAKFNSEKTALKFIKTGGLQHALRR